MQIYGEKARQQAESESLRRNQHQSVNVKALSAEEKEAKIREMQENARRLDEERDRRLGKLGGGAPESEDKPEGERKDAKFLRDLN
jgi:hypothetical protein